MLIELSAQAEYRDGDNCKTLGILQLGKIRKAPGRPAALRKEPTNAMHNAPIVPDCLAAVEAT